MDNLKVLLICSSRFAIPAMRDLVQGRQLAAVVIPKHRVEMVLEVKQLLAPYGIPVITVTKEDHEAVIKKQIKDHQITIVFMMTYSYKLTKAVYDLPEKGLYNFHPGPLPEYRGADPIFQQLKNNEKYAGVTVHKLDDGLDTGPVVIKEMIRIAEDDTYGILNNKLSEVASKLAGIIIKMIGLNIPVPSVPQDESKARYYERQTAKDIVIKWETMNAENIIALINACNPWNKGAITSANNKIIRFLQAEKSGEKIGLSVKPGTVIRIEKNRINIATINEESIDISYIYTDEGFLAAGRLNALNINVGSRFLSLP